MPSTRRCELDFKFMVLISLLQLVILYGICANHFLYFFYLGIGPLHLTTSGTVVLSQGLRQGVGQGSLHTSVGAACSIKFIGGFTFRYVNHGRNSCTGAVIPVMLRILEIICM